MENTNPLKESLGNFLRNLWDLMILNWLWTICCLPVVTIGPATCGLFAVTLKLVRGEPVYPVKYFFQSIRDNFKQGFLLGLLAMALFVLSGGDLYFAVQQTGILRSVYLVIGIIMAAGFLTVTGYAFALQAMFENPLKIQLRNAVLMAFVSPGRTIGIWLILLLPVLSAVLLPPVAIKMLGFVYLVAGVSGPVYCASKLLRTVFDRVNGGPVVPQ